MLGRSGMDYTVAAKQIASLSGTDLRPAEPEALAVLTELGVPQALLRFYGEFEPQAEAEIGKVRLLPVVDVVVENTEAVPGADLRPHGFVTFATTIYGDAYCFDTGLETARPDAPVVIMTHEVIFEDLDHDTIMGARKIVATGFDDWLAQFVAGGLETEPNYPSRE
jgi:hypothetical protein